MRERGREWGERKREGQRSLVDRTGVNPRGLMNDNRKNKKKSYLHVRRQNFIEAMLLSVSVSVSVHHRIQMTGDENGVGGRVRSLILAYWLVVIGVFFKFGFEGRNGL